MKSCESVITFVDLHLESLLGGLPVPVLTKKDMAGLSVPGRPCRGLMGLGFVIDGAIPWL